MEAPDKIYLGIGPLAWNEPNTKVIYAEWVEDPYPGMQNITYIRKDALLEWAKAKKSELFNGEPTDVAAGINAGLDMIIKKLKSL